jgi:predicted amidohydrolase
MRIALGIPKIEADWKTNVQKMADMAIESANAGATLILFSEAAVTGFVGTGDKENDLMLAQSIPGEASKQLAQIALLHNITLGFGLYENADGRLYDTYVIVSAQGKIHHQYRRMDAHWHKWFMLPKANLTYAVGTESLPMELPIGRATTLICGDLFNEDCLAEVIKNNSQWLILPMARGFDSDVKTSQEWHEIERFFYTDQAQKTGAGLIVVNQLCQLAPSTHFFGGAMVMLKSGAISHEFPLHQEGILYANLDMPNNL